MPLPGDCIQKSGEIAQKPPRYLTCGKTDRSRGKRSSPELNVKVCCNQMIKVRKGKVVEWGDVEEIVGILNIQCQIILLTPRYLKGTIGCLSVLKYYRKITICTTR